MRFFEGRRGKEDEPELNDGGLGGLGLSLSDSIVDGVEVGVSVLNTIRKQKRVSD